MKDLTPGPQSPFAGKKILLVDDHEPLAQALSSILKRSGYEVVVNAGDRDLLRLMATERPDLLLLDIMMPHVDGLSLLERLKEDEQFRDLPVLMMSSMDAEEAAVRSLGLGASDFLPKPIRQRELLARVETHLRLGKAAADSRKEAKNRAAMIEILHEITDSLKPDEIYNILVRRVARVLNISKCSIVLAKPGDQTGVVVASFENPMLRNLEIELSRYPEIEAALNGGRLVLVPDVATDPMYAGVRTRWQSEGTTISTRSAVAVPFDMRDRQVGVFFLRTTAQDVALTPTDAHFAESVISAAVAAIEKAYDFETAVLDRRRFEQLASTDPLTGVLNRRALGETLETEVDRARRYNLYLSILLADLDRFKEVNDRRGHLAGDAVLRQVGSLLLHEARSVDIVARYGGEEFVVIMPETAIRGAAVFAERVRGKIAATDFAPEGEEALLLTVSIGLAGFPDERVTSAEGFIAIADQALYRAKHAGRNLVRE